LIGAFTFDLYGNNQIKEIEAEMARTQKNKATNYHLGTLKAKLAKLRSELFMEQSGGSGGGAGEGFDVARNGDARVALIGFPSVGKSSLLGALTSTESEAAAYEFTTLTTIPGVLKYVELCCLTLFSQYYALSKT